MKIAVLKETAPGEARVALVPETVKRLAKKIGFAVETGAGAGAFASDDEYRAAGAEVGPLAEVLKGADLVLKVQPPAREEIARLPEGTTLVSLLYPLFPPDGPDLARALAARKVTALALDLIPRTTLAQMMDVLSSQATISGYRAVVLASEALPKLFPMLMTAAGTIAPARALILGAVVEAFDVRKVVKEQVESLGAKFIEVPTEEDAQTASGYAKEVSEDYKKKQAILLEQAIGRADVCITTALIP